MVGFCGLGNGLEFVRDGKGGNVAPTGVQKVFVFVLAIYSEQQICA